MTSDTVDSLQRQLLAVLKGHHRAQAAAATRDHVRGVPPDGRSMTEPPARSVREIRERILELDPQACLYESWGGAMPRDWSERRSGWSAFDDTPRAAT